MKKILQMAVMGLLLTACSKNDDNNANPEPLNPAKECHLVKLEVPGQGKEVYTYNASGQVIKVEQYSSGTTPFYICNYTYNAENQLKSEISYENGTSHLNCEYEYANGLLSIKTTTQSGHTTKEQFIYDANGRLIEVKSLSPGSDFKSLYEYDSNGNVVKIKAYTSNLLSYESTYFNYDNKPFYYGTLTGLNIPDEVHDLIGFGKIMKNNPGNVKHVFYSYQSGGVVQQIIDANDTYTYTYNENNFPATITVKDKDGDEYKLNTTYDCK